MAAALYALHQDFWFWRTARPLVFGFIPIGLSYHAVFTLLTSLVLWLLVKHAWPARLEAEIEQADLAQAGGLQAQAQEDEAS
jgi:hypothetical protein